MSISVMKQALEALSDVRIEYDYHGNPLDEDNLKIAPAIKALEEAIAEAQNQKPVACQHKRYLIDVTEQIGTCIDCGSEGRMRFVVDDTHPQPKSEWVGLTNMEIQEIYQSAHWENSDDTWDYERAIEAKLKEKNT